MILIFVFQRFIQYLASRNTLFNLSNFLDKSGSHGKNIMFYNFLANVFGTESFDFFIYSKFIEEVLDVRTLDGY